MHSQPVVDGKIKLNQMFKKHSVPSQIPESAYVQ